MTQMGYSLVPEGSKKLQAATFATDDCIHPFLEMTEVIANGRWKRLCNAAKCAHNTSRLDNMRPQLSSSST